MQARITRYSRQGKRCNGHGQATFVPRQAWPGGSRLEGFASARLEGVRRACADLRLDEPDVQVVSFDPQETSDALKAWRVNGVTGICAFNDEQAIGLIHASRWQGVSIPTDVAIVGVDKPPWGALTEPALTTVAPNAEQIGQVITELVMAGLGVPQPSQPT
jgi:DNA-binding LacI/PurR family transcriptional regulator